MFHDITTGVYLLCTDAQMYITTLERHICQCCASERHCHEPLEVDYEHRSKVAPNHTMTHVLNWALREVGTSVGTPFVLAKNAGLLRNGTIIRDIDTHAHIYIYMYMLYVYKYVCVKKCEYM